MDSIVESEELQDDMISYRSSQINLVPSDIQHLDERIALRRRAFSDSGKGKARLSTGPGLPTIVTTLHPEHCNKALSASSCSPHIFEEEYSTLTQCRPSTASEACRNTAAIAHQSRPRLTCDSGPLNGKGPIKSSASQPPPSDLPISRPPLEQAAWDTRLRHRRRQTSPSHHVLRAFDGASDSRIAHPSARYMETSSLHFPDAAGEPGQAIAHFLDPVAPVFTPRVRFGSTTVVRNPDPAVECQPPQNSDSDRSLRLQTPSEQNAGPQRHHAPQESHEPPQIPPRANTSAATQRQRRPRSNAVTSRPRRLSENNTVPDSRPNLERYPLLLPTTNAGRSSRNAFDRGNRHSSQASVPQPQPIDEAHREIDRAEAAHQSPRARTEAILPPSTSPRLQPVTTPEGGSCISPRASPIVHNYSSSLPWRNLSLDLPETNRLSSSVNLATKTPNLELPSESSSCQRPYTLPIDAAAEFLKFRSSPLDGLTAELSRLSTVLGPPGNSSSVGQTPNKQRNRIRLLSGDLLHGGDVKAHHTRNSGLESFVDSQTSFTSLIEQSEPSLSRLLASPSRMTLTKPAPAPTTLSQPRDPLPASPKLPSHHSTNHSSKVTFETASPSRPQHLPTTATPRLSVYNDTTPAHLQPQTPADIHRSSRRSRNRSDSSVHRETFCVGQVLVAPRPAIPERSAYRNTYPTIALSGGTYASVSRDPIPASREIAVGSAAPGAANGSSQSPPNGRYSVSEEIENQLEEQLAGLEIERDIWLGRRLGGSLDVTPPREGRFERFLS